MNCANCRDTGHKHLSTDPIGRRVHSVYLDCAAPGCNAAHERADLAEAFPLVAKDWPECLWLIHQRARKMEREESATSIAHLTELRALVRRQEAELAAARASLPAAGAQEQVAPPVTPKHIEEIKDLLLWPVTKDDARVARDMLQSVHFDLSMQEGAAAAQPAAAAPDAQDEPLAVLTLGGIEGGEYDSCDIEIFSSKAIDKLQEKLVKSDKPVVLNLYAELPSPAAAQPEAKAAPAKADEVPDPSGKCHKCHGNSITHAAFCPLYDQAKEAAAMSEYRATPAPAMGEELPPLPHWWAELEKNDKVLAYQFKNHMEDYGRACMALRQTGADLLAKMKPAPVAVSSKAEDGSVPAPTNANMAKMMVLLGSNWLVANAPDKPATAPVSQPAAQDCSLIDAVMALPTYTHGDGILYQRAADVREVVEQFTAPQPLSAPAGSEQKRALYTCIGKGGEYELIGRACAAGQLHDVLVSNDYPVYRDTESGLLFVRVGPDFDARMQRLADTVLTTQQEQSK